MAELAFGVGPHFEDHGAKTAGAPTNGSELLRVVALLVDDINLVEDLLCRIQAYSVFPLDLTTLRAVEFEPMQYVTVIPIGLRVPGQSPLLRNSDADGKGPIFGLTSLSPI